MLSDRIVQTAASPYWKHLTIEVVSAEAGEAVVTLEIKEEHMQAYGVVHGGALASLVDCGIGAAVQSILKEHEGSSTTNLQIIYARPAKEGLLTAEAKLIRQGRTMVHGDCRVVDESGELVVHGTASFMILDLKRWGKDKPMLYKSAND